MQSSPMDTQEEEIHDIARSTTPGSSQAVQPTHTIPIQHRGASSAGVIEFNSTISMIKSADQPGASGRDYVGTLPFMALDLQSEEGMRGEIPRRYRHDAESFAWSLIYLYFVTVEGEDSKSYIRNPKPLQNWFRDRIWSHTTKRGLIWHGHDITRVPLAHPNTRALAGALYRYWTDRYERQFADPYGVNDRPSTIAEIFGIKDPTIDPRYKDLPYKEPEDERVFQEVLVKHERGLYAESLREVRDDLVRKGLKYKDDLYA